MDKHSLLADTASGIFGSPIVAPSGFIDPTDNPQIAISNLLATGLKLFIVVASLVLLIFLLWGALDWIISGGEKEKIGKAQSKITNSIIGFLLIFVVLAIFGVLTGDILGVVTRSADGGWIFNLPTLGGPPIPPT
jgi:fumarate reductase subunit D